MGFAGIFARLKSRLRQMAENQVRLSREEDATAAGSSWYRCERLPGALSGVGACRSALLRELHAK